MSKVRDELTDPDLMAAGEAVLDGLRVEMMARGGKAAMRAMFRALREDEDSLPPRVKEAVGRVDARLEEQMVHAIRWGHGRRAPLDASGPLSEHGTPRTYLLGLVEELRQAGFITEACAGEAKGIVFEGTADPREHTGARELHYRQALEHIMDGHERRAGLFAAKVLDGAEDLDEAMAEAAAAHPVVPGLVNTPGEYAKEKMRGSLSSDDARALLRSNWWVGLPARDVALAQLEQDLLCMPMAEFQRVVDETVGRHVMDTEYLRHQHIINHIRAQEQPCKPADS